MVTMKDVYFANFEIDPNDIVELMVHKIVTAKLGKVGDWHEKKLGKVRALDCKNWHTWNYRSIVERLAK